MPSPLAELDPHAAAVTVEGLVIRYGETVAVDGISFAAAPGEITVVLGPNGAGKTSTIEHLEGYRAASAGRTRVLGLDPSSDHHRLTATVGLMLQQGGIPTGIRPGELLRQYAGFFAEPHAPSELLARVGLSERARTPYRRLSGGEQQRLSLALAVVGRPRVVFLDEPTAGVDLEGRDLIRELVRELRADGVCVLITTHDLDEAERLADRIVIIDHGKVVADATPAELMSSDEADHLLFGAPTGLDLASVSQRLGASVVEVSPGEYRAETDPSPSAIAALTSWLAEHDLQLADLRAGRQRLDDVFRRLTAEPTDNDAVADGADGTSGTSAGTRGRRRRSQR